jgi:hypothetical protein
MEDLDIIQATLIMVKLVVEVEELLLIAIIAMRVVI